MKKNEIDKIQLEAARIATRATNTISVYFISLIYITKVI